MESELQQICSYDPPLGQVVLLSIDNPNFIPDRRSLCHFHFRLVVYPQPFSLRPWISQRQR